MFQSAIKFGVKKSQVFLKNESKTKVTEKRNPSVICDMVQVWYTITRNERHFSETNRREHIIYQPSGCQGDTAQ